jgi:hypothetical protein
MHHTRDIDLAAVNSPADGGPPRGRTAAPDRASRGLLTGIAVGTALWGAIVAAMLVFR